MASQTAEAASYLTAQPAGMLPQRATSQRRGIPARDYRLPCPQQLTPAYSGRERPSTQFQWCRGRIPYLPSSTGTAWMGSPPVERLRSLLLPKFGY